jgi:hypothetical protein
MNSYNILLLIIACIVLVVSIWAFMTRCNGDKFNNDDTLNDPFKNKIVKLDNELKTGGCFDINKESNPRPCNADGDIDITQFKTNTNATIKLNEDNPTLFRCEGADGELIKCCSDPPVSGVARLNYNSVSRTLQCSDKTPSPEPSPPPPTKAYYCTDPENNTCEELESNDSKINKIPKSCGSPDGGGSTHYNKESECKSLCFKRINGKCDHGSDLGYCSQNLGAYGDPSQAPESDKGLPMVTPNSYCGCYFLSDVVATLEGDNFNYAGCKGDPIIGGGGWTGAMRCPPNTKPVVYKDNEFIAQCWDGKS